MITLRLRLRKLAVSEHVYDLLARLLDPNPHTRVTAQQALSHTFFLAPSSSSKSLHMGHTRAAKAAHAIKR